MKWEPEGIWGLTIGGCRFEVNTINPVDDPRFTEYVYQVCEDEYDEYYDDYLEALTEMVDLVWQSLQLDMLIILQQAVPLKEREMVQGLVNRAHGQREGEELTACPLATWLRVIDEYLEGNQDTNAARPRGGAE